MTLWGWLRLTLGLVVIMAGLGAFWRHRDQAQAAEEVMRRQRTQGWEIDTDDWQDW